SAGQARRLRRGSRGHGRDDARQRPGGDRRDPGRRAGVDRQPRRDRAAAPRSLPVCGRALGDARMLRTFDVPSPDAERHLARLGRRGRAIFSGEAAAVAERAVADIRREGDRALARWRRRHDRSRGPVLATPSRTGVSPSLRRAFNLALSRITAFHERQRPSAARWLVGGSRIEERALPLDSVGVYVPGGEAIYISTAMMTVVPARIAGVRRIVVATPPAAWSASPALRWVLTRLGVDAVYLMGGAHSIAAMAVGTPTIPSVAKIVGPGNRYVAAAKRAVSGLVGIDSIAGPTEVAVFADGSADAEC